MGHSWGAGPQTTCHLSFPLASVTCQVACKVGGGCRALWGQKEEEVFVIS